MGKLLTLCFILTQCLLLSSCGDSRDGPVLITVIATAGAGSRGIGLVSFIDPTTNTEQTPVTLLGDPSTTNATTGSFSFTRTLGAVDGDFIFVTACSLAETQVATITVRILNNGRPIAQEEGIGTDGIAAVDAGNGSPGIAEIPARPACASVEAFAEVEDPIEDTTVTQ